MARKPLSGPLFVLIGEILLASGRFKSVFAGAIAASGLTSMAYGAFAVICDAESPLTVPEVGRRMGHARQVIQRAANELIAAGLVATIANPHHKRAPLLQPTAAGEQFKARSDERAIAIAEQLLRHIDERQCQRMADDLLQLRGRIDTWLRESDCDAGRTGASSRRGRSSIGNAKAIDTKMSI